jgi:hypothetical protein
MLNLKIFTIDQNSDDIKTGLQTSVTPVIQVPVGGADYLLLFTRANGLGRITESVTVPGFNFNKSEGFPMPDDQIDFTDRCTQIPFNNPHSLTLEKLSGGIFATTAQV